MSQVYNFDTVGNLVQEDNPLGQINYYYTYYRPKHKRYCYMMGDDVDYIYGTSGNETGCLVRLMDGSSSYECFYDALDNVTDETRALAPVATALAASGGGNTATGTRLTCATQEIKLVI